MRQSIRGYADGVAEQASPADLARLTDDIEGVWRVVEGSDDLQRALNDPFVPGLVRRALLNDLFENRVGPEVIRLLNFIVDADRASETVDDISWLAGRFRQSAGEEEPILGRRGAEERLEGYATARLEAVPARSELGEIEDELFRFRQLVAGSDELSDALSNRDLPVEARHNLVMDLLRAKATATTTALASYATRIGRARDYIDHLDTVIARVALETDRRLADVRSAVELGDDQRTHLAAALSRAVGHDVDVWVTVDPSVVAGFRAVIGDTVVDGSARHQLEILRERLIAAEAH